MESSSSDETEWDASSTETEEGTPKKKGTLKKKGSPSPLPYEPSSYKKRVKEKIKKNQEMLSRLSLSKTLALISREKEEEPWQVESFIGHWPATKGKGYWELKTRWVSFMPEDDTWEPINQKRKEVPMMVKDYIKIHPEVTAAPVPARASAHILRKIHDCQ